jgi:hypothetical protein
MFRTAIRPLPTLLLLAALLGPLPARAQWAASPVVPASVAATSLPRPAQCSDAFIAHDLAHLTTTEDGVIRMFQGNGSGAAAGDLDNDGDLDLVLGNLAAPNTLLWNEGGLRFRREEFGSPNTRAVTMVDVDADGWLDVVVTLNTGVVNYWRNGGDGTLARKTLPGVGRPAYVLNWGDLDLDGDLDLVTATYDAGLLTDLGNEFLFGGNGGVTAYENRDGRLRPTALAHGAMALALLLHDVDQDGRPDILVGNDFDVRDMAWRNTPQGWEVFRPFAHTTHSTMSLDAGDVHNDGRTEFFASDMKPYDPTDPAVAQAWAPLMADMPMMHNPNDPQVMENVLLAEDDTGRFYNVSEGAGVDATGWAWSARFGDLDADGYLDLYTVNGFTEERLLGHLPDHELVEENQAFRNDGRGRFEAMPAWGLGSTRSGRAMLMADMDGDGDLDIVVNNVRARAQLFENDLCGGDQLLVELRDSAAQNRNALGAQVTLHTNLGPLTRVVRAGAGYLSGDPPQVHFGLGPGFAVESLEIRWPDGAVSEVTEVPRNARLTAERAAP